MTKENWLEIAKSLPCGSKVKVHCCGNSPSMLISHSTKGYSCHCFRCQDPEAHQFRGHGQRSIAEILRHKSEAEENRNKPPHLPKDYTLDIPVEYAWFLKYGISMEVARQYQFGYSEFFHRIVIPIYRGPYLQAVHMRAINPDDKPKYLNLGRPEDNLLFWPDNSLYKGDGMDDLIIVEDVLSAIKLSHRGHNAVALNGSSITEVQAIRLIGKPWLRHFVWLDNDPAGKKGAKDVIKQLKLMGARDVWHVTSDADPKTYTAAQIDLHLGKANRCWT